MESYVNNRGSTDNKEFNFIFFDFNYLHLYLLQDNYSSIL